MTGAKFCGAIRVVAAFCGLLVFCGDALAKKSQRPATSSRCQLSQLSDTIRVHPAGLLCCNRHQYRGFVRDLWRSQRHRGDGCRWTQRQRCWNAGAQHLWHRRQGHILAGLRRLGFQRRLCDRCLRIREHRMARGRRLWDQRRKRRDRDSWNRDGRAERSRDLRPRRDHGRAGVCQCVRQWHDRACWRVWRREWIRRACNRRDLQWKL
jgi:hypothetical protein